MGGVGSGRYWRWNEKSTTDDFRCLDVRRWAREGLLNEGRHFGWSWSIGGETVASIQAGSHLGFVQLMYKARHSGGDWRDMSYRVELDYQRCNFGGWRVWFRCPAKGCGARVAKLYGGEVFACRKCHDLTYPSQKEVGYQRAFRRADKIRERLGWETGFDSLTGEKPKGMHWTTFDRLTSELAYAERIAYAGIATHMSEFRAGLSERL